MADDENIWDAVTVLRKNTRQIKQKDPYLSNQIRNGNTESVKKQDGRGGAATKAFKLDESNDAGHHQTVSRNLTTVIQKARSAQNMTRSQLAQKCCVKENVIASYENGSAIPDNKVLGIMERNLKVKLRGKKEFIGNPLNK
jgi:ribosome-binding protein aMBF1 (putative translation factor)